MTSKIETKKKTDWMSKYVDYSEDADLEDLYFL